MVASGPEVALALRDKMMIAAVVLLVLCVVGFGAMVSSLSPPAWTGWCACLYLLEIVCTFIPIIHWYGTHPAS